VWPLKSLDFGAFEPFGLIGKLGSPAVIGPEDGVCSGEITPSERMMMIAFITMKSSLVLLIEGLCAQIYFRIEISVVCSHLLLFFFVKEKIC